MREIRVSPDGNKVAIRSDWPEDHPMAWGYFDAQHGGGWIPVSEVEKWKVVDLTSLANETDKG